MARAAEKNDDDHSRHRSPNYPAIGLPDAVERVKALISKDGKAGAPLGTAAQHIGFSGPHGTARTVLSALKKFGLILDQRGRIVPTQLAVDLTSFPAGHDRNITARQTAALSPVVYKQLIDRYSEIGNLPSDESMRAELIADMGFNPKAVDAFVQDFVDSLVYAGLLDGERTLLPSGSHGAAGHSQDSRQTASAISPSESSERQLFKGHSPIQQVPLAPGKQMRDLTLPLMDNEIATLRIPTPLSEENYEYLVQQIAVLKRGLVAKKQPADAVSDGSDEHRGSPYSGSQSNKNAASLSMMITHEMRRKLLNAGFTPAEIADMTPQEAWIKISHHEGLAFDTLPSKD